MFMDFEMITNPTGATIVQSHTQVVFFIFFICFLQQVTLEGISPLLRWI